MREILPGQLWIGNASDGRNIDQVLDAGIMAMVDLALEEAPPPLTHEIIYCRFPIIDGADNEPDVLQAAVGMTAFLLERQLPTLVYCGGGTSRAPAIAAAALARARGERPDDCLRIVTTAQPHDVTPTLWQEITHACFD